MDCYLFIGGAGFIGSSIIRYLSSQPSCPRIVIIERPSANVERLNGLDYPLHYCSLEQVDLIEDIIKQYRCTHVIHLVSSITPSSPSKAYAEELKNVVRPTIDLLGVCCRLGVKFVYFSSGGAIYGNNATIYPLKEDAQQQPVSFYGLSKQITEANIRFEHRVNGLQYLILRPSNPYGIGQDAQKGQGFIATALDKVLKGEPITIWGDGSIVRDYIYISDLARIVSIILKSKEINKVINIGSGIGISINDVVEHIADITGVHLECKYEVGRDCDVKSVVLDTMLMNRIANVPLTSIRTGISRFYKHLLTS